MAAAAGRPADHRRVLGSNRPGRRLRGLAGAVPGAHRRRTGRAVRSRRGRPDAGRPGRRPPGRGVDQHAYSIQRPDFFVDRPEFNELDAFVDSLDLGVRKPAPEAYLAAATVLGVDPASIVFLDDVGENVEGARAVGMCGIEVDSAARISAFDHARRLLGLME